MESHDILRQTVADAGVKSVASDMRLSPSLIYKWCEKKGEDASGADNPLDRLLALCQVTGKSDPIIWLCEQVNGVFVDNPNPAKSVKEMEVLQMTQRILREFTDMLDSVSRSMADDSGIDAEEAAQIRTEWEELKRVAEQFVLGCEMGQFPAPENHSS